MKPLNTYTMIIPSIKQRILLYFIVNFSLVAIFNIMLVVKSIDFITDVIFHNVLALNTLKIGMLVSVFVLTFFILKVLFFASFLKNDFKRSLSIKVKEGTGKFLAEILNASVIYICGGTLINRL